MKRYPWLMPAYQQLISPLYQQRAPHAWLISYVAGSGEMVLLNQFIATLFCTNEDPKPCGTCHSCLLYKAGTHPDFYSIFVAKDKKLISIEQIRKLIEKVYEHAQQGGVKVIWIKKAALLSEGAANALLKTVEEPPSNTYFILSDEQPNRIIATIRSRCFAYYLPTPNLADGIHWLQSRFPDYNSNQLATALLLTKNAVLAAGRLLRPESWQKRQQFCQMLSKTAAKGEFWSMLAPLNAGNSSKEMDWFCSFLLDAIKAKCRAGKYITNRDQVALVRAFARHDTEIIMSWYTLWQTAAQEMNTISGLNQQLILANLLAQSEKVNYLQHN